MRNRARKLSALLALLAFSILNAQLTIAFAQGTAFTYQGQLQNNGALAGGTYSLTFALYTNSTGGAAVAGPVTNNGVAVTNGLFTVTIDFGSSVWNSQTNWLEIGVGSNNAASFTILSPRQQLTPAPYAISAESVSGPLPASQLTSIGNYTAVSGNFFVGPSGSATNTGIANTAIGSQALNSDSSGSYNTAEGSSALHDNTSGGDNTANGDDALQANTTGFYNVADGKEALNSNVNGDYNVASGAGALLQNSSGTGNTADGHEALFANSTGSYNIGLGYQAGLGISTGSNNIDIGSAGFSSDNAIIRIGTPGIQTATYVAGTIYGDGGGLTNVNVTVSAAQLTSIGNNSGGSGNFFVGASGNAATSGSDNTANGAGALTANTSGSWNTANGWDALQANTTGYYNTANGFQALLENTSGIDNLADGQGALYNNISGSDNTASGAAALYYNTNGNDNTADGLSALQSNTSGSGNIALGYQAGYNITTGSGNIDIGNEGFSSDTNIIRIGSGQTAIYLAGTIYGDASGLSLNASQLTSIGNNNGGSGNFFVGPAGNATMSGSYNTANGVNALHVNTTGFENTADGASALFNNSTGTNNTANGVSALGNNTSGSDNVANGTYALFINGGGNYNTANGYEALLNNSSGQGNTADGSGALGDTTVGVANIGLGFLAGANITTGSSNIDIGNEGTASDNNIIRIGMTQTATYLVGTVYANTVALTSDRNAKENFTPINARAVLDKVASLPITEWNYKADTHAEHIGPMAQDFKTAFGLDGADDKHISVVDEGGVALAAVQGLDQKLNEKEAEIQKLEQQNEALEKRLDDLEQSLRPARTE